MTSTKILKTMQMSVSTWLSNNINDPSTKEILLDDPIASLNLFIGGNNGELATIGMNTSNICLWNIIQYESSLLNQDRFDSKNLYIASTYLTASIKFEDGLVQHGNKNNIDSTILPDSAALALSLLAIANWREVHHSLTKTLINGLDTSLLDLRHNDQNQAGELYRHFWFLMQLSASIFSIEINTSLYSYPPDMGPYAAVLTDWRTTNLDRVQQHVSNMAEYHLEHARNTTHDIFHEFDRDSRKLFPYEILAFLRVREWAGLPNPDHFDHPLMNQPLAKLPAPTPVPVPETPLLDAVISKFKELFPGSFA